MKRTLSIVCLVLFCLAVRGVETTTHNFNSDYGTKLTVTNNNQTGTYTDGSVYECKQNAAFAVDDTYGICLSLTKTDSVIVSFGKEDLKYFDIFHASYSGSTLIQVSSDGINWTTKGKTTSSGATKTGIEGLNGEQYIKIKNNSSTKITLKLLYIHYYTEPCHCLRVVSE